VRLPVRLHQPAEPTLHDGREAGYHPAFSWT
jgi:hypothetical protein